MENHVRIPYVDKRKFYAEILSELRGLRDADRIANLANAAALLFHQLPDLNWAGFYLFDGRELVLGPFQGRTACVRIALGRGVCGTSAKERRTLTVDDVDAFPGHIACDANSKAEIVVPLVRGDELLGVLDLDAPVRARFDENDRQGLEAFASALIEMI